MTAQKLARILLNGIAFSAYPPIYVAVRGRLEDYLTEIAYPESTLDLNALQQWGADYRDWHATGEQLNVREIKENVPPDPREYEDYGDEAARLVLEAAKLMGFE